MLDISNVIYQVPRSPPSGSGKDDFKGLLLLLFMGMAIMLVM